MQAQGSHNLSKHKGAHLSPCLLHRLHAVASLCPWPHCCVTLRSAVPGKGTTYFVA